MAKKAKKAWGILTDQITTENKNKTLRLSIQYFWFEMYHVC